MRHVVITGCSDGGIGSGLAVEFQRRGFYVFATARNISKMSNLESLPNMTLLELDVTFQSSIEAAAAAVSQMTGGQLDYVVNNCGQSLSGPCLDTPIDAVRQLFDVNYFGPVEMNRIFGPLIIKTKGMIVNVCSTASKANMPYGGKLKPPTTHNLTHERCLRPKMFQSH